MERIGYIYRYDEDEGKGILVYGYNWDSDYNPIKPIKFFKSDCISVVHTGQLVYFGFDGSSSASQIERASLANFKKEVVLEIVSCYDTKSWDDCYRNTRIRFENIEDTSFDDLLDDFDDFLSEQNGLPYKERQEKKLPSSIDELYDVFGTKGHHTSYGHDNSSKLIDILNIEQWIDKDIVQKEHYYGTTAEEVLDLFELFVNKRRIANRKHQVQNVNSSKEVDNSISNSWKLLLASLSKDDLRTICKKEPMLQPALPSMFCLENLDELSIEYGFPNVSICEAFYRYKIKNTKFTSEYRFITDKIYTATHCSGKHKESEGIKPCKIGKHVLHELSDLLEDQYQNVVLNNVKQRLTSLSNNKINGEQKVSSLLMNNDVGYLIKIGNFLDSYNGVFYNTEYFDTIRYDCDYYETILFTIDAYENLLEEDKLCLESSIRSKFRECLMGLANETYTDYKAHNLCVLIKDKSKYLDAVDIDVVKEIVNSEFANLDDLKELNSAADCGLITEKQHLESYKAITKDYDLNWLLGIIKENYYNNIPSLTQEYLIKEIVRRFDFKTLSSFNYVKIDHDAIGNLESLIDWFNRQSDYGHIDAKIWEKISKEMTDELSHEDRLALYEKGLILNPFLCSESKV